MPLLPPSGNHHHLHNTSVFEIACTGKEIQDVILPHTQCSWDKLRIYYNRDKAVGDKEWTEESSDYLEICWHVTVHNQNIISEVHPGVNTTWAHDINRKLGFLQTQKHLQSWWSLFIWTQCVQCCQLPPRLLSARLVWVCKLVFSTHNWSVSFYLLYLIYVSMWVMLRYN